MGEVKKEYVFDENGKKAEKYYCEFGITIDERIADGFYLIKSVHLIEKILSYSSDLSGEVTYELDKPNDSESTFLKYLEEYTSEEEDILPDGE